MITLYLGRHGETKLNSEDKLRGWLDEPLNRHGIEEANVMGEFMKQFPIDRLYCSDLDRADQTATIVGKHHGLKPIPRQWFRPLNYGDMNGKPLAEIRTELQRLNDVWKKNPDEKVPNGESFTEFQERNLNGLHAVISSTKDGEHVMIVAHLRNCLLFHAVAKTGGPLQGESIQMLDGKAWDQSSGSVSKFEFQDGRLVFKSIIHDPSEKEEEAAIS